MGPSQTFRYRRRRYLEEKVFAAIRSKPAQSNAELDRTTRRLKAFHHDLSTDVACGSEIPLNSPFHPHRHGLPLSFLSPNCFPRSRWLHFAWSLLWLYLGAQRVDPTSLVTQHFSLKSGSGRKCVKLDGKNSALITTPSITDIV